MKNVLKKYFALFIASSTLLISAELNAQLKLYTNVNYEAILGTSDPEQMSPDDIQNANKTFNKSVDVYNNAKSYQEAQRYWNELNPYIQRDSSAGSRLANRLLGVFNRKYPYDLHNMGGIDITSYRPMPTAPHDKKGALGCPITDSACAEAQDL